jgi:hypothetical protein
MAYPFSASATDTAFACAYSLRPELAREPDEPNVGGLTGTAFHTLAEHYNHGTKPPPLPAGADLTRAWRMFEQWRPWWDEYTERHGIEWSAEAPYAVSLTTGEGRRLPSKGPRDYSAARADEIPGTIDALGRAGDRLYVADFKTGRADYITPARESGQMRTLGLAATRALGFERATLVVIPVSDLHEPHADEHEIDVLDSDLHEERLRVVVASIPTAQPTPGEHCRFCQVRDCNARPAKFKRRLKVA